MKYIVILGDGMADHPVHELAKRTPLETANKPYMDYIATYGHLGLVRTIPKGMQPGSDIANLSVFGYDPRIHYTGRSSLEAVSMGIQMNPGDLSYRCNLVSLSDNKSYEIKNLDNAVMEDYCAQEMPTQESNELFKALAEELEIELHPGFSYRSCLVLRSEEALHGVDLTPPHDISGKIIGDYLPKGPYAKFFSLLMERSVEILRNHPINISRIKNGLRPGNCAWFWGEGQAPSLPAFAQKFGVTGSVISAVDLIKGLGISAGLTNVHVPGATGNLYTDYAGKVAGALDSLKTRDFVYLHIEAPDECGHRGQIHEKVLAIEYIDEKVIGPIMKEMDNRGEPYGIMVLPDHATPLSIRTHTDEPVPFAYYYSRNKKEGTKRVFDEKNAATTSIIFNEGHKLMEEFISK